MKSKCSVSICIPTCKRSEIIDIMLQSIYSQGVDSSLFEVCISDNSETNETKNLIENKYGNISNLVYKKSNCKGFMNSIEALKLGSANILKLHNDYSKFKPGMLQKFIDSVRYNQSEDFQIFFSMGSLKNKNKQLTFDNFNDFLGNIHYYSTWSSAFSINKSDFDKLMLSGIAVDRMFPHTTLLYSLYDKKKYIVDDVAYVENLPLKKKGGYNLIDNFVRIYLTMTLNLLSQGVIGKCTYDKIQYGIIKFCAYWENIVKFDDKYFFSFDNKEKIILETCGHCDVMCYKLWSVYYFLRIGIKVLVKKVWNVVKGMKI